MGATDQEITAALGAPFAANEIKWKAQVVRTNRALAVAYLDARAIEDRLDSVLGVGGWQDDYTVLANNSVVCRLRVRVGSEWIEKSDVGAQSDQPDEGDRMKSAFSDALKRAAVKWGIGRYLHRIPHQWVDYDIATRQLKATPKLPEWAQPAGAKKGATISREMWDQLKEALAASGIKQSDFLTAMGADKPGQIAMAKFDVALAIAKGGKGELQKHLESANGRHG